MGIAIWYMDDGSTYFDKRRLHCNSFPATCEINTYCHIDEANEIIDYFNEYWGISFHLHKKADNQYCVRCYYENSRKLINLIKPFVVPCMQYKVMIPKESIQECQASQ